MISSKSCSVSNNVLFLLSITATGSGDGKMTRLDAQSPTVQGAQSNQPSQSQQGPGGQGSQQGNNQSQQYMLPAGYHPTGYYYPGVMSHYGIFQQVGNIITYYYSPPFIILCLMCSVLSFVLSLCTPDSPSLRSQ